MTSSSLPEVRAEQTARREFDDRLGSRVAQLAWFELAAAATRRALARQAADESIGSGD
jgi:hypothetical protein